MAWKCKWCGEEVSERRVTKHFLNKDKEHEELYSEKYYYECINCDNCTDSDIEDIADWEED